MGKLNIFYILELDYIGLLLSCLPEEHDEENDEIQELSDHSGCVPTFFLSLQHILEVHVVVVKDTGVGVQNYA